VDTVLGWYITMPHWIHDPTIGGSRGNVSESLQLAGKHAPNRTLRGKLALDSRDLGRIGWDGLGSEQAVHTLDTVP
jgi:hypothetical protein